MRVTPPATDGAPQARRDSWRAPLALALLLAAAMAYHWPALRLPFFADDFLFLDAVRGRSLPAALSAPDPIGNFFRPVGRQLHFWAVSRLGGESPRVFHAVNLGLWMLVLALFYGVARRLAGARAALIAVSVLALHYASDVPLRWASGCQDLIAVGGALAALWLFLAGRRWAAAAALLIATLSKEVVLLTPVIAALAGRKDGERWTNTARRAWPLGVPVALWGLLALLAGRGRGVPGAGMPLDPGAPAATLAHLAQVILGLEWRTGSFGPLVTAIPPILPLALALAALAWLVPRAEPRGRGAPRAVVTGVAWALLGAAPIVPVVSTWSAYYYLFALCGVALALGAWLSRAPRGAALAVVVLLACGSARSGSLEEFALVRSPWTARSHINRHYISRATDTVQRYLAQLRAARPAVPPRSTLFFAGLSGHVGFQTGDGPLVRWAYRDTSARSYYLNAFDLEKARRGPLYFFEVRDDSLREIEAGPNLFYRLAAGLVASDNPAAARGALTLEIERNPEARLAHYLLAWVELALGGRDSALASLRRAEARPLPGPTPEVEAALAALRTRDTLSAIRLIHRGVEAHALDPGAHALLADLLLVTTPGEAPGMFEAYAARTLAPGWAEAWRRWAMVQIQQGRTVEGLQSFERYFALAGEAGAADAEAHGWVDALRRKYPGAADARDRPDR